MNDLSTLHEGERTWNPRDFLKTNVNELRKFLAVLAMSGLVLAVTGCVETKDDFVLNPDGSGKVVHEVTFVLPFQPNMNEQQTDPEQELKDAVRAELEQAKGVDVWKDVSFKRTEEGKIWFKGTAYFKDMSKLQFKTATILQPGTLTKDDKGRLVLDLESKSKNKDQGAQKAPAKKMTEAEITERIACQKGKYLQVRPLLMGMLSQMKAEMSFQLPGSPVEVSNFSKGAKGDFTIVFEGAELLELIDQFTKDDAMWRKQILEGEEVSLSTPEFDPAMKENLLGRKGPLRVVMAGEMKPLFDYAAEVAAAKKDYPRLLESLPVVAAIPATPPPIPAAPPTRGDIKNVTVGGMRLVRASYEKDGITPFRDGGPKGYTLALVVEFPGSISELTGGRVDKAITDNGEDLLPTEDWDRELHFAPLSKDKTKAVFEVGLKVPSDKVRGLKEVSGSLEYLVAREMDLGITEFKADAKGKEYGAVVKSIEADKREQGNQKITLQLHLSRDAMKSVTFYGADGQKLEATAASTMWTGDSLTAEYSIKGKLPATGKIVVEVSGDKQTFVAPFSLKNISLTGQPLN